MPQSSLVETVSASLAKTSFVAASSVFDAFTLPIYSLIQKPWNMLQKFVYSRPIPGAPKWGPLKRTHYNINLELFDGIATVDQLMRKVFKEYAKIEGFGTRALFGEEFESQNGEKSFKKLLLGEYSWITYGVYNSRVDVVAQALLALGLKAGQNICIFADTRMEWMLVAQACFRYNFPVVTLYSNLGEDGIVHGLNETEISLLITSSDLLPKIKTLLPKVTSLRTIVYMENYQKVKHFPESTGVKMIPFSVFEQMGQSVDPKIKGGAPTAEDPAIIMYTSGSTGTPKAVVITHKNIISTAKGFQTALWQLIPNDVYIAYLPLAHIFEITVEITCIAKGMKIGYSSPLTLTDKSTAIRTGDRGDASLLHPSLISCVPLVLDRIRKNVMETAEQKGFLFKSFIEFAIKYKRWWAQWGYQTPLLNLIIFNKIKQIVGGQLRVICAGSAPLSADTHAFIKASLDCALLQGYGLTESTAGATLMETTDSSVGRVGSPLYGDYVKLISWPEGNYHVTDKPHPRGEILVAGDTVTKGYYKNDELTKTTFVTDDQGLRWLYTGDIAELHEDGTLTIIDRKKDLVKLQFGEYISLGKVEAELKTCSIVENVCVYGNSFQNYLVALIAPNEAAIVKLASRLGKKQLAFSELCKDSEVIREATNLLTVHAKKCNLQKMETPKKVKLCTEQWLPDTGLVTAALKIRRNIIQEYYKNEINEMYA